ncbi:MAG: polymerase [Parcubacteria group bacterium]|nr:polymerase [Parcubacteria group bacterium]
MADYTQAIIHFDGDSFFASVEQALDYRLRGKPVVTGAERGAATSLSHEAKLRGVHRSMNMKEIRRICPEAILVPSNYTAYSVFAQRMYRIAREFTPFVEEYSIDECFADITGLAEDRGTTYEAIALAVKAKLEQSLGVTFGVGLAPSKTLAKVASKYHKPAGFTSIPNDAIEDILRDMPVHDIWGLGGSSSATLKNLGVHTALEYAQKSDAWMREHNLAKPMREIWLELQGYAIKQLTLTHSHRIKSIMKTRTFTPPSLDQAYIFSQLSKNVEAACQGLRWRHAKARAGSFYLKTQEFTYHSVSLGFPTPTNDPSEVLKAIAAHFSKVYATEILYRASGVTLHTLVPDEVETPDLFGDSVLAQEKEGTLISVDALNRRHGHHTVFLGSTLAALSERKDAPARKKNIHTPKFLQAGDSLKKSLNIPYLGTVH